MLCLEDTPAAFEQLRFIPNETQKNRDVLFFFCLKLNKEEVKRNVSFVPAVCGFVCVRLRVFGCVFVFQLLKHKIFVK